MSSDSTNTTAAAAATPAVSEPRRSSSPSRAELAGPDRSQDRCHELGQKSLRCQMEAQIKYDHQTLTKQVKRACQPQLDAYLECYRRETDKRKN